MKANMMLMLFGILVLTQETFAGRVGRMQTDEMDNKVPGKENKSVTKKKKKKKEKMGMSMIYKICLFCFEKWFFI